MKSCEITLTSINDVKNFVNIVNNYDFDVDLVSVSYTHLDVYTRQTTYTCQFRKSHIVQTRYRYLFDMTTIV